MSGSYSTDGTSLHLMADLSSLKLVRDFVETATAQMSMDAAAAADLVLAVDELVTNIIKYGYRGQAGPIEIDVSRTDAEVSVRLRDRAPRFDPTRVPGPNITLPLHERPMGGLGIYLARAVVDTITYQVGADGANEVILTKHHIIPNIQEEHDESHS